MYRKIIYIYIYIYMFFLIQNVYAQGQLWATVGRLLGDFGVTAG